MSNTIKCKRTSLTLRKEAQEAIRRANDAWVNRKPRKPQHRTKHPWVGGPNGEQLDAKPDTRHLWIP